MSSFFTYSFFYLISSLNNFCFICWRGGVRMTRPNVSWPTNNTSLLSTSFFFFYTSSLTDKLSHFLSITQEAIYTGIVIRFGGSRKDIFGCALKLKIVSGNTHTCNEQCRKQSETRPFCLLFVRKEKFKKKWLINN